MNEAIRLDPKYSGAYFGRGVAWNTKPEYDKAISDFNDAIRLDPNDSKSYVNLAWILATCPMAQHRNGRKAVEDAEKACELTNWKDYDSLDTLAAAYAEAGDFDEAVKWQEKAIELAPEKDKADLHARLELYKSGKPYREQPKK